jgi:hypothetical protein
MYKVKQNYIHSNNKFIGYFWLWVVDNMRDILFENKNWNENSLYLFEFNDEKIKWKIINDSFNKNDMIRLFKNNKDNEIIEGLDFWVLELYSRYQFVTVNWNKNIKDYNQFYLLSLNPNIVECDYLNMKKHFLSTYGKELIEWHYHPKNQIKWKGWGFDI